MQSIHTIAFDLIQQLKEKNSVTEEKNMVKSDQCLRLFSSWRQPPLLVKAKILQNDQRIYADPVCLYPGKNSFFFSKRNFRFLSSS